MQIHKIFALTLFCIYLGSYSTYALATKTETAIFAGGCFWSMQHDFKNIPGVIKTTVGYTGGSVANPSYEQVSTGKTGHYEVIQIEYDPTKINYQQLMDFYWHDTDPTNALGQFCDTGNEYRPAIFYLNNDQKTMAVKNKQQLEDTKHFGNIATQILPAKTFFPAEDYHQHYSDKNPTAYDVYRLGCRRDRTRDEVWGGK